MDNGQPFLNEIAEGWKVYQAQLNEVILPLTAEELAIQLSPNLRPVSVVVAHIIAARVWWFRYVMQEGTAEIEPMVTWDDDDAPTRSAGELVAALETTWALVESGLRRWTAADMGEVFYRPGSNNTRSYTRQWIIWHVLEHDLHHGGEVSFALGAHGLPALDL